MIVSGNIRYVNPDGTLTIQGLRLFGDLPRRLDEAERRLEAIAAVAAPAGGATTDAEARAAIAAILAGAA